MWILRADPTMWYDQKFQDQYHLGSTRCSVWLSTTEFVRFRRCWFCTSWCCCRQLQILLKTSEVARCLWAWSSLGKWVRCQSHSWSAKSDDVPAAAPHLFRSTMLCHNCLVGRCWPILGSTDQRNWFAAMLHQFRHWSETQGCALPNWLCHQFRRTVLQTGPVWHCWFDCMWVQSPSQLADLWCQDCNKILVQYV